MIVEGQANIRTMSEESRRTISDTNGIYVITKHGKFEIREFEDGTLEISTSPMGQRLVLYPNGTSSVILDLLKE